MQNVPFAGCGKGEEVTVQMKIAIGLLAHNEERGIQRTLHSLLGQTVFDVSLRSRLGIESIQVVCLANGCVDQTSLRVREVFDGLPTDHELLFQVYDIAEPGKSRSWNIFVHSVSDPEAKYLILLDADIELGVNDLLESLVRYLECHPDIVVATDRPIKLIKKKKTPSVKDRISLKASDQLETAGSISGQLYCGRASELREIWMPLALPVEDGFLAAMIITSGFTAPESKKRIAQIPDAFHYYEAHEGVSEFIRHETRIVVGGVINSWLYRLLWERGKEGHVGAYIRDQNQQHPGWLDDLVREQISKAKWLVPLHFVVQRLRPLKGQAFVTKLKMSPIAILATLMEIVACVRANQVLKRSGSVHFW